MLLHRKSGALFDDTLIGDYYTLTGINIKGTFRVSSDFSNDFDFVPPDYLKLSKKANQVEWNRSLIYYIGKDRANQKKKKLELKNARLDKALFRNITEQLIIKDNVIKGLDLQFPIERIEKFDYERILPADINFGKTPKAMEERFAPAQYGKVLLYGVIINTDYLYYLFENGVRVELKKARPEGESNSSVNEVSDLNNKSIKSKDKKASAKASGLNTGTYDMKYLEQQLNLPATKIRTALRRHFEKPEGGWKWDTQEEVNKVIAKIKK